MENKCLKCDGINIVEGKLVGYNGVIFIPEGAKSIFNKKYSAVTALACTDCGHIFDLKLKNPDKVK